MAARTQSYSIHPRCFFSTVAITSSRRRSRCHLLPNEGTDQLISFSSTPWAELHIPDRSMLPLRQFFAAPPNPSAAAPINNHQSRSTATSSSNRQTRETIFLHLDSSPMPCTCSAPPRPHEQQQSKYGKQQMRVRAPTKRGAARPSSMRHRYIGAMSGPGKWWWHGITCCCNGRGKQGWGRRWR